jgi:hypothetical protein
VREGTVRVRMPASNNIKIIEVTYYHLCGNRRWPTPSTEKKSAAKAIIVSDLESGVLDEDDVPTARVACDQVYSHMHEFADVTYERFVRNLEAERGRFRANRNRAAREELLMQRDGQLHTRNCHNSRGEPVFDMHPAKLELREDDKAGPHKGKSPSGFQKTQMNYEGFDNAISKNASTKKKGYKSTIIIAILRVLHLESKLFAPLRNSAHGRTQLFTPHRNSPILRAVACEQHRTWVSLFRSLCACPRHKSTEGWIKTFAVKIQ